MKTDRTLGLTALGAAIVLGAAGYLITGGEEGGKNIRQVESAADTSHISGDGHWKLPAEAYLPNKEQRKLIAHARGIAIEQCMKGKGFSYRAPSSIPLPDDGTGNLTDGRYGIHDRAKAARFGYHPDPELQVQRAKAMDASSKSFKASPEPERRALMGSTSSMNDGCVQEAKQKFAGTSAQNSRAVKIANEAYDQAKADVRVKRVFAGWAACMHNQGFSYSEPMQANDDVKFATRTPTEQEIKAAVADVDCRVRNDVNKVWYETEKDYQNRLISRSSDELEMTRRRVAHSVSEARSLIKG
ncbi:hypothetical protein AB0F13_00810 [Streptomyces sp. NPDC026206]|uniref:hypothetical protein n=1 Tax=Streptomyces sp. NPDC026206 TaxID=3157089 RepID=UPI0033CED70F